MILVVSETVSIHERIALIVVDEIDFIFELELILFTEIIGVLRVGTRLRKLTRFKNDGLLRSFDALKRKFQLKVKKRRDHFTMDDD